MQEILLTKGDAVITVDSKATVLQAAQLMNEHKIGAVVVTEAGRVGGIFTERDVLRRVVGEQRMPAETLVGEVMSCEVVCARDDTTMDQARNIMKNRRIRHLPVVSQSGELLGVVSIGDLNAWHLDGQEQTIHYLHEYLYGRV